MRKILQLHAAFQFTQELLYCLYYSLVKTLVDYNVWPYIYQCTEDLNHYCDLLNWFPFLSHHPLCLLSETVCWVDADDFHNKIFFLQGPWKSCIFTPYKCAFLFMDTKASCLGPHCSKYVEFGWKICSYYFWLFYTYLGNLNISVTSKLCVSKYHMENWTIKQILLTCLILNTTLRAPKFYLGLQENTKFSLIH